MSIEIRRATVNDSRIIAHIGRIAVELSHRASCSMEDMISFLDSHYNENALKEELSQPEHIYHLISYEGQPAGFSKIILNTPHPNIAGEHITKLDRIYLMSNFYDQKLGLQLLNFNADLARKHGQQGMWLFTWQGNERAVNFYKRYGFKIAGEHRFKVTETHYNPHYQMFLPFE